MATLINNDAGKCATFINTLVYFGLYCVFCSYFKFCIFALTCVIQPLSALNKKWLFGVSICTAKGSTVKEKSLNMIEEMAVSWFTVFPTLISVELLSRAQSSASTCCVRQWERACLPFLLWLFFKGSQWSIRWLFMHDVKLHTSHTLLWNHYIPFCRQTFRYSGNFWI